MRGKSIHGLGPLQRAIMEIVWKNGPLSVNEARERLNRDGGGEYAYTTILSSMQKLEKLGWLTHERDGKTYVYSAVRSREQEGARALKSFIGQVFGGDSRLMMQQLIREGELSAEELDELRKLIDRRKREMGK